MNRGMQLGVRLLVVAALVLTTSLVSVERAEAGAKFVDYGVQVSYSGSYYGIFPYLATVNGFTTLVVEVYDWNASSLMIKALSDAPYYWGGYLDVIIYAPNTTFNNLKVMGTPYTYIYVAGQVWQAYKYMHKYGYVGDTDALGTMGLGARYMPLGINMKYAAGAGPVLGVSYSSFVLNQVEEGQAVAALAQGTTKITPEEKAASIQRLKELIEKEKP